MGPNKIYELIVTIINALGVAFTDTDKQALFTVLPFVINTANGQANNCSMNSIYKHMTHMLDISRSAAESRLRRALKRLQDNVDRMTYQNIFMSKESDRVQEQHPSQHDILYCVVEYVVDEIQKEIGGPAQNQDRCDCECLGEPDCNHSPDYEDEPELDCGDGPTGHCCEETQESPCSKDCECESCCCECEETRTKHSHISSTSTGCESDAKSHVEQGTAREQAPESAKGDECQEVVTAEPEPVVCHTRYPFEDGDGITKKGIISHILSQFELPFICHTKEIIIECLMCLIGDQGEISTFTYFAIHPNFTFMDKVSLFFDILSFEVDFFNGLSMNEMQQYFGKKTKFILMKPSRFMFRLANVISRKHINQLIKEGKY